MSITVERMTIAQAPVVFDWVMRLLTELGEEGDEVGSLATEKVLQAWKEFSDHYSVFVAKTGDGRIVGILTLTETFAIYANGNYGVIDEMYVTPEFRSKGVGKQLVEAAKQIGKEKGWARIDVTAPESERWERTRKFYEKEGFGFTGPKLKFLIR
jgi:GNAT superfamily N-acetyltransferase